MCGLTCHGMMLSVKWDARGMTGLASLYRLMRMLSFREVAHSSVTHVAHEVLYMVSQNMHEVIMPLSTHEHIALHCDCAF